MEIVKNTIEKFATLSKDSKKSLYSLGKPISLKKGDYIAEAGSIPENIYILKSGVARSYFTDKKGKEYTRNIFTSIRAVGPLGALILNKPSKFSYDCLSDCELIVVNFKQFKKLTTNNIEIGNFYAKVLEYVFLELESKVYDLSVLNATERYLKLKRNNPNIENLIPQYHIASFLNITPVQLSRIRKEIYTKK
ncbi:MAG: Crp/Fnr family transcriptional regulator [Polaribacter sp.]